jgi:dTDP-4-dehydrorhamnose 3,5-epimerase
MLMLDTAIHDVKIIVPDIYEDERGFFMESYNAKKLAPMIGEKYQFVQDNHSYSTKNVLRGLHFQRKNPQGKLIRVVRGEIFDVSVDLRKSSPTFGKAVSVILSDENLHMLWVPPEFAHGFLVLSDVADVMYKTTDFYAPNDEYCLRWNDPSISIQWPTLEEPILSPKDNSGKFFKELDFFP